MWLFIAFITIPLLEIGLLLQLGSLIGLWPTLLTVILTAILGTKLVQTQGLNAISKLQASFSRLENPSEHLAHGAMILISGALLLTPGFLTDTIGFAFLIPAVRLAVYHHLRQKISTLKFHMGGAPHQTHHTQKSNPSETDKGEDIVIVEYKDITPANSGNKPSRWTKH
jgi:UPF0716 protein FxsA